MDHVDIALFMEEMRALLIKHDVDGVSGVFFVHGQALVTSVTKPGEDVGVYDVIRELLSRVIVTTPGASLKERGAVYLVRKKPDTGDMPF